MRQFSYLGIVSAVLVILFSVHAFAAQPGGDAQDINPIEMQLDRAAPANFAPDTDIEIQVTISANTSEGITAVGLRETPPAGWTFGNFRPITGDTPAVSKQDPATSLIEFAWITPPQLPITFAYTLHVPPTGPESSGSKMISGQAEYRTNSGRLVTAPVITTIQGKDTVKPEIILQGGNPLVLEEGQSFQEPGYTAYDDVDGDVTGQVKVSGNVDTSTPGSYELTYTVIDKAGNVGTKTRTVRIKQKPKPPAEKPPVAGGPTTPPPSDRRVATGAVATVFDNDAGDEGTSKGQAGPDKGDQDKPMENTAATAKPNKDAGQAKSPENVGPKIQYNPSAQEAKDKPIADPKVVAAEALKKAAENTAKSPADAKGNETPAVKPAETKEVAAAAPAATVAPKAEVVAKKTDTALPVVQDTAPTAVVPAVSTPLVSPQGNIFERINENLAKLTRQELMTLAGLGLAILVLSMVAFVFWRGAYRSPMRR